MIKIKRIYEGYDEEKDGFRVLVDRVWPRGISKEKAHLDEWLKEIAPTKDLRKWFNHEDEKYPEFKKKYLAELQEKPASDAVAEILEIIKNHEVVTLLYGAKNETHNQAVVLQEYLQDLAK